MTVGVPVIAANRGALPEVLGDAGLARVDPTIPRSWPRRMQRVLTRRRGWRTTLGARGARRIADRSTGPRSATTLREAYEALAATRRARPRAAGRRA